jgi:hypothetical protein
MTEDALVLHGDNRYARINLHMSLSSTGHTQPTTNSVHTPTLEFQSSSRKSRFTIRLIRDMEP